jgi:hypothetical protein
MSLLQYRHYITEKLSDIAARLFVAEGTSSQRLNTELDSIVWYICSMPNHDLVDLPHTREFKKKIVNYASKSRHRSSTASKILQLLLNSLSELKSYTTNS